GRGTEAFAATPISLAKVPATIKPVAQPVAALPRLTEARPRTRSVASTADDESWEQF
ncbi:hypothetical protein CTATCC11996_13840, partial [Comamonas testosteroni ATCC 11996]